MKRHRVTARADQTLTPGQLAKRWRIGMNRLDALLDAGWLPGVFTIPAAGGFGAATRIPLADVERVESGWRPERTGNEQSAETK